MRLNPSFSNIIYGDHHNTKLTGHRGHYVSVNDEYTTVKKNMYILTQMKVCSNLPRTALSSFASGKEGTSICCKNRKEQKIGRQKIKRRGTCFCECIWVKEVALHSMYL